jgi:hypothetical protein
VEAVGPDDYIIGICRLGDRMDRTVPLTTQRMFSFDNDCVYGAITSGIEQMKRIEAYERDCETPMFYAFYDTLLELVRLHDAPRTCKSSLL